MQVVKDTGHSSHVAVKAQVEGAQRSSCTAAQHTELLLMHFCFCNHYCNTAQDDAAAAHTALAAVTRDKQQALALCRQYEQALPVALQRIEEACILHLGNAGVSPLSTPVKDSPSDPLTGGKLSRLLDRILRRLAATQSLREQFTQASAKV
jgi:hypothetical protein